MRQKRYVTLAVIAMLGMGIPSVYGADPQPGPAAANSEVYGWQLMTPQERAEHRDKMRSLKTAEERQKFREEHHKQMEQRAKERGVTLPDAPRSPGPGGGPRR